MEFSEKPVLLDTTLRDGSYAIDFQFTERDTELLAGALDRIGLPLIEIGHGIGINASKDHGQAAVSDVGYVQAARKGVKNAEIGMFCIPGIAELDHLKECADAGLTFVRIGTNVHQYRDAEPFIDTAHKLGLFVCTNFMKSYVMPPEEFAKIVRASANSGSQMIYLVDSAGGMLPEDVEAYFTAMASATDVMLGFHGHNNLGLAVANSLAAIDCGATIVDTTLLGMGRSSGNAPTEIMAPLIQRRYGTSMNLDPLLLLNLGERAIAPLIKNRWEDTEKTALGLAQVHSMYAPRIRSASASNEKDYFSLIAEVGKRDRLNLSDDVLDDAIVASAKTDSFSDTLGPVSLLEPLDDDVTVEVVVRSARKTNQMVFLTIKQTDMLQARYGESGIHVVCSPVRALELLDASPSIVDRIKLPEEPHALDQDQISQIRKAAEAIEYAA